MADKLPVKAKFSVGSPTYVVGLQEFEPTDTINVSLISGFSTAVTSELGNNSINSLGDINIPSPSDGQVLTYNSTSGLWEAVTPIDNDISAVWGNITGTLSNQTDLQTALNGKSDVGHTHVMVDITDSTWISDITNESIKDLLDVSSSMIPSDGQVLTYNSTSGLWEARTNITTDELVKVSSADTTSGYLSTEIVAGNNINISILNSGADEKLQISYNRNGMPYIATIGGNDMVVFDDTVRGKTLSSETQILYFAEAAIGNNDWIQVQHASDADSGYIMPFNGTIVSVVAQCENTNGNTKDINLYINATNQGSIGQFTGLGEQSFTNTSLNIDVAAGDKIRLRGAPGQGTIQDTNIQVRIKWRL